MRKLLLLATFGLAIPAFANTSGPYYIDNSNGDSLTAALLGVPGDPGTIDLASTGAEIVSDDSTDGGDAGLGSMGTDLFALLGIGLGFELLDHSGSGGGSDGGSTGGTTTGNGGGGVTSPVKLPPSGGTGDTGGSTGGDGGTSRGIGPNGSTGGDSTGGGPGGAKAPAVPGPSAAIPFALGALSSLRRRK
jgi:hypothetical protein